MSIEDSLYPLLAPYFASPQWIKKSVGQAYSFVAPFLRGRHHGKFLGQALLSDESEIRRLGSQKLAATLRLAIESVPAYKKYHHLLKDLQEPELVLRQLPFLNREDIQRDAGRLVSTRTVPRMRLKTFTGGSTTSPMMFYLHKGVTRTKEYAFMEAFHSRMELPRDEVVLALRGRSVPSAKRASGPLWMYEPIKRQLILSSDHLEPAYMPDYMEAIRAWKPRYIQAYPSAIYPLARWLQEHPAPDVSERIKGIMLYSESIFDHHMSLLREVFDCPVLKHYGHSERVLMAASMADDERYFFWPQYGHFELVDEAGEPITEPGRMGEIVGTGFDNHVMPLIRYRTGDMAILGDKPHPLLPGFPVVERIEGRLQEFIVCRDHRLISLTSMSAGHTSDLALAGVDLMQFEQEQPGHFVIKVVARQPLSTKLRRRIAAAMEAKTQGGCTAEVVEVGEIQRTIRGKHLMLVQYLDMSNYMPTHARMSSESG